MRYEKSVNLINPFSVSNWPHMLSNCKIEHTVYHRINAGSQVIAGFKLTLG
jgi:hypothetical protein